MYIECKLRLVCVCVYRSIDNYLSTQSIYQIVNAIIGGSCVLREEVHFLINTRPNTQY